MENKKRIPMICILWIFTFILCVLIKETTVVANVGSSNLIEFKNTITSVNLNQKRVTYYFDLYDPANSLSTDSIHFDLDDGLTIKDIEMINYNKTTYTYSLFVNVAFEKTGIFEISCEYKGHNAKTTLEVVGNVDFKFEQASYHARTQDQYTPIKAFYYSEQKPDFDDFLFISDNGISVKNMKVVESQEKNCYEITADAYFKGNGSYKIELCLPGAKTETTLSVGYLPSIDGWGFPNITEYRYSRLSLTDMSSQYNKIAKRVSPYLYNNIHNLIVTGCKILYFTAGQYADKGECAGMALSSALAYQNFPPISQWKESAQFPVDITNPNTTNESSTVGLDLYDYILAGYLVQDTAVWQYQNLINKDRWTDIIEKTEYFEKNGEKPILIGVQGNVGGHALFPYKVINSERETRVYVYDCNDYAYSKLKSSIDCDNRYISFTKSGDQITGWSYQLWSNKDTMLGSFNSGDYISYEDTSAIDYFKLLISNKSAADALDVERVIKNKIKFTLITTANNFTMNKDNLLDVTYTSGSSLGSPGRYLLPVVRYNEGNTSDISDCNIVYSMTNRNVSFTSNETANVTTAFAYDNSSFAIESDGKCRIDVENCSEEEDSYRIKTDKEKGFVNLYYYVADDTYYVITGTSGMDIHVHLDKENGEMDCSGYTDLKVKIHEKKGETTKNYTNIDPQDKIHFELTDDTPIDAAGNDNSDIASGVCGSDVVWVIDKDGQMTISGSGYMESYYKGEEKPWDDYREYIKKIVVADGVTEISKYAFSDLTKLTSLYIGESVEEIGVGFIDGDKQLDNISVSSDNENYYTKSGILYRNQTLFRCPESKKETFVIKDGTHCIEDGAFKNCVGITKVNVRNSVTVIGNAFEGCDDGLKIIISDNVEDYYSDRDCTVRVTGSTHRWAGWKEHVTDVIFSPTITRIDDKKLADCTKLTEIIIPDTITVIGSGAFNNCKNLVRIHMGNGVSYILEDAFSGTNINRVDIDNLSSWCSIEFENVYSTPLCHCGNLYLNGELLENVNLPNDIHTLKKFCFYGVHSMKSFSFTDELKRIEYGVFSNCSDLKTVKMDSWMTWLAMQFPEDEDDEFLFSMNGRNPFADGQQLYVDDVLQGDVLSIPDGINKIREYTFEGCSFIKTLIISDSVNQIGKRAFYGCKNIEKISFGNGVKNIDSYAFENCISIQSLYVPNNMKVIDDYAFYNCDSLSSISIPESVGIYLGTFGPEVIDQFTQIELRMTGGEAHYNGLYRDRYYDYTYMDCQDLNAITKIVYEPGVTKVGDYAFSCLEFETINIPEGITELGIGAFLDCSKLKSISLPSSLNVIKAFAISGCDSLSDITIPDSVVAIGSGNFQNCPSMRTIDLRYDIFLGDNCFEDSAIAINLHIKGPMKEYSGDAEYVIRRSKRGESNDICNYIANGYYGYVKKIIFEGNIEILKSGWFFGMNFKEFSLPVGLKTLESYVLNEWKYLQAIYIPKTVTDIKNGAFSDSKLLDKVYYGGSINEWNQINIDSNNDNLKKAKIYCNASKLYDSNAKISVPDYNNNEPTEEATTEETKNEAGTEEASTESSRSTTETGPEEIIKVKSIKITGLSQQIAAGKKVKLTVAVSPENAANKKVSWKSSNKKYATVTSTGVVTMKAKSAGKTVKITATAKDGSKVKAVFVIKGMKGIVKKIVVTGLKQVKVGKTIKLSAKVTATKGANKKLNWTSSNVKYAIVSTTGKVKAKKAGKGKTVKITAMATDGSGKKKTVSVKIK